MMNTKAEFEYLEVEVDIEDLLLNFHDKIARASSEI